jgi:hypothetical protein
MEHAIVLNFHNGSGYPIILRRKGEFWTFWEMQYE